MAGPALDKIAGLECCADVTVVDLGFGSALVGSGQRLSLVLHGFNIRLQSSIFRFVLISPSIGKHYS